MVVLASKITQQVLKQRLRSLSCTNTVRSRCATCHCLKPAGVTISKLWPIVLDSGKRWHVAGRGLFFAQWRSSVWIGTRSQLCNGEKNIQQFKNMFNTDMVLWDFLPLLLCLLLLAFFSTLPNLNPILRFSAVFAIPPSDRQWNPLKNNINNGDKYMNWPHGFAVAVPTGTSDPASPGSPRLACKAGWRHRSFSWVC
jgi:hypothetical protein